MDVIGKAINACELNDLQKQNKKELSKPNDVTEKIVKSVIKDLRRKNKEYIMIARKYGIQKEVVAEIHRRMMSRISTLIPTENL